MDCNKCCRAALNSGAMSKQQLIDWSCQHYELFQKGALVFSERVRVGGALLKPCGHVNISEQGVFYTDHG